MNRTCPARTMFSYVTSWRGIVATLSPAVKTMWSTCPHASNNFSMSFSTVGRERSQTWPETFGVLEWG